jgi:hypothetical protein
VCYWKVSAGLSKGKTKLGNNGYIRMKAQPKRAWSRATSIQIATVYQDGDGADSCRAPCSMPGPGNFGSFNGNMQFSALRLQKMKAGWCAGGSKATRIHKTTAEIPLEFCAFLWSA